MPSTKRGITFRIDDDLLKALEAKAERDERSLNATINRVVRQSLAAEGVVSPSRPKAKSRRVVSSASAS